MADIFVTEEFSGEVEENSETEIQPPQVEVVIEETEEPQQLLNDISESVKEPENCSDMTLKQGEPETDQFSVDGLIGYPDDLLPPVMKLEKYADSEIALNRQVVVRNLLDTLRVVQENPDHVSRVISIMCSLSEDYDPIVRSELMGQFPHIAAFCKEAGLNSAIHQYLWPILISHLGSENNQVRKASHTTLLTLVEQLQIDSETMKEKICPLVVHLTISIHPEEIRTDSILLMSKLAVLLGKKITEEFFMQRIFDLCTNKTNSVRKACASTFGEICTTVGRETTEKSLLPKFIELCKDTTWCVRKACAENFMAVSCVVSRETRCQELSEIYMVLLNDSSRWVRVTAYQGLGPFISTFAEPDKTGLYYSKDGTLTVVDVPQSAQESEKICVCNESTSDNNCINNPPENSEVNGSNVERTSTPESCDSLVPLSCPEKSLTASEIPGIPCHVGNYCTVIKFYSSSFSEKELKRIEFSKINFSDSQSDSTNCDDGTNKCDGVTHTQLWHGFRYNDTSESLVNVRNVDISKVVEDTKNATELEAMEKSHVETALLNSITINGDAIPMNVADPIEKYKKSYKTNRQKLSHNSISEDEEISFKPTVITVEPSSSDKGSPVDTSAFNHFQYWRMPLPEIDISTAFRDLCSMNDSPKKRPIISNQDFYKTFTLTNDKLLNYSEVSNIRDKSKPDELFLNRENKEGEPPPEDDDDDDGFSAHDQDIVPADLLQCYLSMIDTSWTEIAHHCAYSLPAVALTLGRKFWPCLKETFDALSSDLQGFIMMWKVRRTVASSMHQLAVILGPDITSKDLLPVFSRFISDLDEVRIGILQHISEFLKVLHPEERRKFLPSLSEFLVSNSNSESSEKNWRFRLILAEQLVSVADLYEPQDVKDHLVPLSLTLIQDKICEVRLAAVRVMAAVMRRMSQHTTSDMTKAVLSELTEKFIHSPKWIHRQLYVYVCQECIVENSLPPEQFAEDALPQLLYLCWDRVPNVRIAIARCLAVVIWPLETYSGPESPHRELLLQTIHTLQGDCDADVQFYANMVSTLECSCLQHGDFPNLPV